MRKKKILQILQIRSRYLVLRAVEQTIVAVRVRFLIQSAAHIDLRVCIKLYY